MRAILRWATRIKRESAKVIEHAIGWNSRWSVNVCRGRSRGWYVMRRCATDIRSNGCHQIRTSPKTDRPEVIKASTRASSHRSRDFLSCLDYLHSPTGFSTGSINLSLSPLPPPLSLFIFLKQQIYANASFDIRRALILMYHAFRRPEKIY